MCIPWALCPANTFQAAAGTALTNSVCRACPAGSSSPAGSLACTPNVMLAFTFSVAPAVAGASLTADMANKPTVLAQVSAAFAAQLSLPVASGGSGVPVSASAVRVVNITDIATGATTTLPQGRRLGGAAGSAGVRFTTTVDLGSTGTQATAVAMQTALAAMPPTAPAFTQVVAAVATAASIPPTALAAARGPPAVVANAPFTITTASGAAIASSSSSDSGSGAGGAAGGAIAAAIVVFIGLWAYRSYAKHGQLPCTRDRAKEKRAELERIAKLTNVSRELEERSSKADALARENAELRRKLSESPVRREEMPDFSSINPLGGKGRSSFSPAGV